ncbi:hypothetical protein D0Y65_036239, partial [Glycine soja]
GIKSQLSSWSWELSMRHSWVAYYSLWRKFKPSYSWNLSFVDTLEKWCRICQKDIADPFQGEPVSRAVLSLCILDFTRTYPLCKNPFFTFPASYIRILGSENVPCAILFQVQIAVEVNKRKKRSAVRRFLKKDMADLLGSSLDYNAYGRSPKSLTRLVCYKFSLVLCYSTLWLCSKIYQEHFFSQTQFLLTLNSSLSSSLILTQNQETMKSDREEEKEKENDHCISSHMQTLHRRLLHALNLGTRSQLAPPSHPVTSLQVLIP